MFRQQQRVRIRGGYNHRAPPDLAGIVNQKFDQCRGVIIQVITRHFDAVAGILERVVPAKQARVHLNPAFREPSDSGDTGNRVTENHRRDGDREGVRSS